MIGIHAEDLLRAMRIETCDGDMPIEELIERFKAASPNPAAWEHFAVRVRNVKKFVKSMGADSLGEMVDLMSRPKYKREALMLEYKDMLVVIVGAGFQPPTPEETTEAMNSRRLDLKIPPIPASFLRRHVEDDLCMDPSCKIHGVPEPTDIN